MQLFSLLRKYVDIRNQGQDYQVLPCAPQIAELARDFGVGNRYNSMRKILFHYLSTPSVHTILDAQALMDGIRYNPKEWPTALPTFLKAWQELLHRHDRTFTSKQCMAKIANDFKAFHGSNKGDASLSDNLYALANAGISIDCGRAPAEAGALAAR